MSVALTIALALAIAVFLVWLRERLTGFSAQSARDYRDLGPGFDLRHRLDGAILCEGAIYGPMGRVTSRFKGDFVVTWDGDRAVMQERFEYDSGEFQDRAWHIELGPRGEVIARADDILGEARGREAGPTVQMRYRIRLPADAGGYVLSVNDWMYLAPNGTIVNRSQFRKYGIKVAELVAVMRKKETE